MAQCYTAPRFGCPRQFPGERRTNNRQVVLPQLAYGSMPSRAPGRRLQNLMKPSQAIKIKNVIVRRFWHTCSGSVLGLAAAQRSRRQHYRQASRHCIPSYFSTWGRADDGLASDDPLELRVPSVC